jgi:hypothetical protein
MHAAEQAKFVEVVESELLSLHEGNFARYRIWSSEFAAWKALREKRKLAGIPCKCPK